MLRFIVCIYNPSPVSYFNTQLLPKNTSVMEFPGETRFFFSFYCIDSISGFVLVCELEGCLCGVYDCV